MIGTCCWMVITTQFNIAHKRLRCGEDFVTRSVKSMVIQSMKEIGIFEHSWGDELRSLRLQGQVLQREELCKTGLYFICPTPVYNRVLQRLGGKHLIPSFPTQPAAIHFVAYDYAGDFAAAPKGKIIPLDVVEEHCTTVYKVQEAFSALNLPEGNVYGEAIRKCLYG